MSKEGQAAIGSLFAKPIIDLSSFPLLSQGAEGVCLLLLVLRSLPFKNILSVVKVIAQSIAKSQHSRLSDDLVLSDLILKVFRSLLLQRVYDGQFLGRPSIIKQRFSKKYRHSSLDAKLTQLRFKQARFSSL